MKMMKLNKLACSVALALTVAACGGGGGGDSSPTPSPAPAPAPTPTPTPPASLDEAFASYLTDLADNHIVPGYQTMDEEAQALLAGVTGFCDNASPLASDLDAVKTDWAEFNQAWQAVQWIKVGPVVDENRLFRVQFFPDTNNAVSRGVENLLLEQQTVTADIVAGQNVGGQGIPALEYLLYPAQANASLLDAADRDKRCEVASAIAQNLANISSDVNTAWQPSGDDYRANLIAGTGEFTSIQDAVEELVTNWLEQLELVKDEKMLVPLGDASPGDISITEHVLSDESFNSIRTNLNAFLTLYTAGDGNGFDDILTSTLDQGSINSQMLDSINASITAINNIQSQFNSYEDLLQDEAGRAALSGLIDNLRDVRDVLTTGFVQALDINIGFNANDGD